MIVTQARPTWSATVGASIGALVAIGGCAHDPELHPQPIGWTRLEWQTCPEDVPGSSGADCALVEVPLDWDEESGEVIRLFGRRFRPKGTARGQLWALDGGPGEAGDGFVAPQFRQTVLDAGYELIVPSHRGSAYGTTLACPGADAEASCIAELFDEWGAGLAHFDTHAAARDVRALVEGYPAKEDQRTLVFGGSYGTVWGQRVLQVAPDLFDGAYFDSLGDIGMSFEQVGAWSDRVGRELLGRCAAAPACDEHFTGGIDAALERVEAELTEGGGCIALLGATRDQVQALFMGLLDGVEERALIAPVLQRLDRCEAEDRTDLQAALTPRRPEAPSAVPRHNPLLNLVVIYRELYRVELDTAQLEAIDSQLLFDDGAMAAHHRRRRRFPEDFARSVDVATSNYAGALHLVHGQLDPRSPEDVIDLVGSRWPHARLDPMLLPEGGHASPRFSQRRDGERCSTRWLTSFLQDPSRDFDVDCLGDVPSIDLAGERPETQAIAEERFGWDDVWGNP